MYDPDTSDPNDPVKISFMCDAEFEGWVDEKVAKLREYDEGFYVMQMSTNSGGSIYYITTTARHLGHDDFKRFLFQIKLKFGEGAKIR